jgi:hypothetical protein
MLLLLFACDAGTRAPVPPAKPLTAADGRTYAVVELKRTIGECSNLGGTHYSFAVDESGVPRMIHAGGHGAPDLHLANDTYYVAEVMLKDRPDPPEDDAGWCLADLPAYSGEALRFVPARDLADARVRLAAIRRDGLPATAYTLGF